MNTIFLVYTADAFHSLNSKNLESVCTSFDSALKVIEDISIQENFKLSDYDYSMLKEINQTQSCERSIEFQILPIDQTKFNVLL